MKHKYMMTPQGYTEAFTHMVNVAKKTLDNSEDKEAFYNELLNMNKLKLIHMVNTICGEGETSPN